MSLRCRTWLCVPLNTDCLTQDNCCLLFVEGPSATFCTLHLKIPQVSAKSHSRRKRTSVHLLYMSMHLKGSASVLLCHQLQLKSLYNFGCHYIYFGYLHIACVVKLKFTSVLEFTFFFYLVVIIDSSQM